MSLESEIAAVQWSDLDELEQAERRIADYLVAMADYHMNRDFIHPRRESMVVTPENRTPGRSASCSSKA